jgi:hypothetical protein
MSTHRQKKQVQNYNTTQWIKNTALLDDMTYKETNMEGKGDKRGLKKIFDYSDNEQPENMG